MHSFIVRIYRQSRRSRRVVGVVEEAGAEERRAFTSLDELWRILTGPRQAPAASRPARPPRPPRRAER